LNFAPRIGIAWAPGSQPYKTTIRAGFGFFYDRVGENLTLNTIRFNGLNQQQYTVTNLAVLNTYPNVPSLDVLEAFKTPVSIYSMADDIEAPYSIQSIVSVERALPRNFRTSVTFSHTRTLHMLRARAINAPLPGTFIPNLPGSGVYPLGVNRYFEYDSTGVFDQNMLIVTLAEPSIATSPSMLTTLMVRQTATPTGPEPLHLIRMISHTSMAAPPTMFGIALLCSVLSERRGQSAFPQR
jgi:hypothetical protein